MVMPDVPTDTRVTKLELQAIKDGKEVVYTCWY